MINCIKKVYNKLFNPLPELEPGVYPISIKFFKPNAAGYRTFKLEYCIVDKNGKHWPSVHRIVDDVDRIGFHYPRSIRYDYRNIISDYIQAEFKLRKAKGELE